MRNLTPEQRAKLIKASRRWSRRGVVPFSARYRRGKVSVRHKPTRVRTQRWKPPVKARSRMAPRRRKVIRKDGRRLVRRPSKAQLSKIRRRRRKDVFSKQMVPVYITVLQKRAVWAGKVLTKKKIPFKIKKRTGKDDITRYVVMVPLQYKYYSRRLIRAFYERAMARSLVRRLKEPRVVKLRRLVRTYRKLKSPVARRRLAKVIRAEMRKGLPRKGTKKSGRRPSMEAHRRLLVKKRRSLINMKERQIRSEYQRKLMQTKAKMRQIIRYYNNQLQALRRKNALLEKKLRRYMELERKLKKKEAKLRAKERQAMLKKEMYQNRLKMKMMKEKALKEAQAHIEQLQRERKRLLEELEKYKRQAAKAQLHQPTIRKEEDRIQSPIDVRRLIKLTEEALKPISGYEIEEGVCENVEDFGEVSTTENSVY